ncbi:FHA domain-containing protein [Paenibacillus sp. HJGM_3]|uniref:FHA domain-containing protein n=1 Tax=Paenibacillus sp. HJGM_3 TaxID=3379816 RepID=UPI00385A9AD4
MDTFACLYVIRGEPFRSGTCLNLFSTETCVGRSAAGDSPDVAFTNAFISRKHFVIRKEDGKAVLYDLGSRHGTEINGIPVVPHKPYLLQSMDIIKLAKGMTVIHFSYLFAEQTLELEPITITQQVEAAKLPLTMDWEKRECIVDGRRIGMSEKEYLLLKLLFDHANRLVPIPEIKHAVWPERVTNQGGQPDVHMDELNALMYRIRKKFGANTFVLNAVRGSGYVLESDSKPNPNKRSEVKR